MSAASTVLGVLLAGGRARRMGGGDKGFRQLAGRPLMDHVVERARPQVARLLINAGGDPARFDAYGLPVVADVVDGFAGPLAGVLTGLEWAAAQAPDLSWVATFATDAPFLPTDLVERLMSAAVSAASDLACATSGGRAHPVFGLWPVAMKDDLRRALIEEDVRKIDVFTARHRMTHVDFPVGGVDPFFNVNTPEDLAQAQGLADSRVPGPGLAIAGGAS